MAPPKRPAIERFRNLTTRDDKGCMVWTGHLGRNGYARHWVDGRNVLAHRWSYEYHVGPIPEGLFIDHLCRNRACVNPDHLEPVTPAENVLRGLGPASAVARGRAQTHCLRGHPLDGEDVRVNASGHRLCLICKQMKAKEHYAANRAVYIEKAAAWRVANLERSREMSREGQRRYREKKKEVAQ